jgi:glucose-1-phosphate adenylyltransferase
MLAFHDSAGADITVSVIPVPMEEAHRFGTLVLENNGYVSEYMEKPDAPKSNLASMGIYIFNKDVLLDRLTEDARQADSVHDFGYSIIPPMVGNDKVFAYKYEDFWRDIGTIESYYNTSMELVGGKLPFALNGKWPVLTCENSSAGKTNKNVNIVNSVIGPGCIIKGKVNNSILSAGVKIDEQTVVNNSIVYSNVIIGAHSLIDASIIDENVTVGDFSYVGFGKNQNKIADCTILGKGCTIASHTAIAHSCKIAPYTSPTKSISKERVTTNHGEGIPFLVSQQRNQAIISS